MTKMAASFAFEQFESTARDNSINPTNEIDFGEALYYSYIVLPEI